MENTIQNNSKSFDIIPYLNDRGWSIDLRTNQAKHSRENQGLLEFKNYLIYKDNSYEYSFRIKSITSGTNYLVIGNSQSENISTTGYFQGIITPTEDGYVSFYSDSDLEIEAINITMSYDENVELDNETIVWSEDRKGWISFRDYLPENGFSMFTNLLTVKDGALYLHTPDSTYNNFYGKQYDSKLKFSSATVGVKSFHSIAIHANKVLGTTEDGIETQLGNVSDLISIDFTSREGIHYANFLRDKLTDDKLKGRYIVIELTDEETKGQKLQLFKTVIKSNISTPNE